MRRTHIKSSFAYILQLCVVLGAFLAGTTCAIDDLKHTDGKILNKSDFRSKNVLLFLTDQERATQHFPKGWDEVNMPNLQRLKRHGLSFNNAYTSSNMCSPSRATLFTGLMPAQHKVRWTLEAPPKKPSADDSSNAQALSESPPGLIVPLDPDFPTLGDLMTAAGFKSVVYKGKFHFTSPPQTNQTKWGGWTPEDMGQYGFSRWNPWDSGYMSVPGSALGLGGGGNCSIIGCNDQRTMYSTGSQAESKEGVLAYVDYIAKQKQSFFLVVSLVNPHDVLLYPKSSRNVGYNSTWEMGSIKVPPSVDEDMSTKPPCQLAFGESASAADGALPTVQDKEKYLNFYGNLLKSSDKKLGDLLDSLEKNGLLEDTLIIKTADHGELGMTHKGMRQKSYNYYDEATRVPLVFSNPKLWPTAQATDALVSHVDLVPTLASLYGTPKSAHPSIEFTGVDYSSVILGTKKSAQGKHQYRTIYIGIFKELIMSPSHSTDYIMFTFDEQAASIPQPAHLVAVRTEGYKLAKYIDYAEEITGVKPYYEMYDMKNDTNEVDNLAAPGKKRTAAQEAAFLKLKLLVEDVRKERLQPIRRENKVDLKQMNITRVHSPKNPSRGAVYEDAGMITGKPVGEAKFTMSTTITSVKNRTASGKLVMWSNQGIIRGKSAELSFKYDGGLAFSGEYELYGGTGAFRTIEATTIAFKSSIASGTQKDVILYLKGEAMY